MVLFSGFTIPLRRFYLILHYANAIVVAVTQIELSIGEILPSCFAIPLHRFYIILWNAVAFGVTATQSVLSVRIATFCGIFRFVEQFACRALRKQTRQPIRFHIIRD